MITPLSHGLECKKYEIRAQASTFTEAASILQNSRVSKVSGQIGVFRLQNADVDLIHKAEERALPESAGGVRGVWNAVGIREAHQEFPAAIYRENVSLECYR